MMQAEQKIEESLGFREFAKLYRFAGIGQVLVMLDLNPDGEPDAEIRLYFDPGVDALGVCSSALGFTDMDEFDAAEKAEEAFKHITPEAAKAIAEKTISSIREMFDNCEREEGSGDE